MRKDSGLFAIERIGKGTRVSSFNVIGPVAKEIVQKHRVAPHRLIAILGAAEALTARENGASAPLSDLAAKSTEEIVITLQSEFGFGWGWITTLHFLTDLGLSCKPDIWLTRTVAYLGLYSGADRITSLRAATAINEVTKRLTEGLKGSLTAAHLREVDKVLMEIGKQQLFSLSSPDTPVRSFSC